jgi:hypothetical protein
MLPAKASERDLLGRFREIISDPVNLLVERIPAAGFVQDNDVFLHNGNRVPLVGDAAYYGAFSQRHSRRRRLDASTTPTSGRTPNRCIRLPSRPNCWPRSSRG